MELLVFGRCSGRISLLSDFALTAETGPIPTGTLPLWTAIHGTLEIVADKSDVISEDFIPA